MVTFGDLAMISASSPLLSLIATCGVYGECVWSGEFSSCSPVKDPEMA